MTESTVTVELPRDIRCKVCGATMVEVVPEPGIVWSVVCRAPGCRYAMRLVSR